MPTRAVIICLLLLLSGPGGAQPAPAAPAAAAADKVRERQFNTFLSSASRAYKDRDWAAAIRHLQAAQALLPQDPRVLYNLGRAYEQLGQLEEARDSYRSYLQTGNQDKRAAAEAYLRVVEAKLDQARYVAQAREREAAGDPTAALAALEKAALLGRTLDIEKQLARLQAQVQEAREREAALRRPQEVDRRPEVALRQPLGVPVSGTGRTRRPAWRIVLGALSIAGGVTLSGLGAGALSVNGQCGPSPGCPEVYATAGVGGGFLGAGLALAAAGTVLIVVPGAQGTQPEGAARAPSVERGGNP